MTSFPSWSFNADSDNHGFSLRTFLDLTNTATIGGILHRKCGVVFGRPLSDRWWIYSRLNRDLPWQISFCDRSSE
ncbi:hypothetical protein [Scytonema sp. PRP1]|uniref:hypothetical protein n=1 Tax=Scytonema sp. PRP1 TaxID=3120513 RepID=UPI00300CBF73